MSTKQTCGNCSEMSDSQFTHCWKCGASLSGKDTPLEKDLFVNENNNPNVSFRTSDSHLSRSVLTVFLFCPSGLLALVFAEFAKIQEKPELVEYYVTKAANWRSVTLYWLITMMMVMVLLCGMIS